VIQWNWSLKPGFEISPGKLISFPVKHLHHCEEPVTGKPPESVCHICVGDSVGPVVGPGQVIDSPDENNGCYVVFTPLSIKFWNFLLFHFESECSLSTCRNILFYHLSGLIIVNLASLIIVNLARLIIVTLTSLIIVEVELYVSCWVCHTCLEQMFTESFWRAGCNVSLWHEMFLLFAF
jgi:hypothetical protein